MRREDDNEDAGSLAPLVRQLPREVAPSPDLWKGIAARLEPRGRLDHLAASLPTQVDPPRISGQESRRASRRVDGCDALPSRSPRPFAVAAVVAVGLQLGEHNDAGPERAVASVAADDTASDGAGAAIDFGWVLGAPAVAGDDRGELERRSSRSCATSGFRSSVRSRRSPTTSTFASSGRSPRDRAPAGRRLWPNRHGISKRQRMSR